MWQSLSFGRQLQGGVLFVGLPGGRGRDWALPRRTSKEHLQTTVVKPLKEKEEAVYVIPRNSDAEEHVAKRFPHKTPQKVRGSLHPKSIDGFLEYMHLQFQPGKAKDLTACYHFTFTGAEQREATVRIDRGRLEVDEGHVGDANLKVKADAKTWIGFLAREKNLAWALLTRRIRLTGSPLWLVRFGKCFPS